MIDVNARRLVLQNERRRSKDKAKYFSGFFSILLFGLGIGLIYLGASDFINGRERSTTEPYAQSLATDGNQGVRGASTFCEDLNLDFSNFFVESSADREWYLLGNEFTDQEKTMNYTVRFRYDIQSLFDNNIAINSKISGVGMTRPLIQDSTDKYLYRSSIELNNLAPGAYKVETEIVTECGTLTSEQRSFSLSYPVYVVWTMDWEGYVVSDAKLEGMDAVSSRHYNVPMTHFFNPRYFLPGVVEDGERDKYLTYVKNKRDTEGHSIGLHLHGFPELFEAAGVSSKSSPRWGWNTNDGYDVLIAGYSYEDMMKMLSWSDQQFRQYGLGSPNMFRAGGWWIEEDGLRALEDSNYLLDSSGRATYQLGTNGMSGPWTLDATTQPYRPNYNDQNSSVGAEGQIMQLWQFPNNGADSTAFSADKLYSNFKENYNGVPVKEHKIVNYLSHPDYFHIDQPKIDETFTNIDRHLYLNDSGPVIYTTLDQVFNVYINR